MVIQITSNHKKTEANRKPLPVPADRYLPNLPARMTCQPFNPLEKLTAGTWQITCFKKENHLPKLQNLGFQMFIFQGVYPRTSQLATKKIK